MFIHCKKNLEIREGENMLSIPAGFIGDVPAWAAEHWFFKAAMEDGTISAPEGRKDADLEKAARKKGE